MSERETPEVMARRLMLKIENTGVISEADTCDLWALAKSVVTRSALAERQAPGNPAGHPAEATNEGREIAQSSERSSADWRRLTGLWRYGVSVLPPTAPDFYNWLGVLDAAIDERMSRLRSIE